MVRKVVWIRSDPTAAPIQIVLSGIIKGATPLVAIVGHSCFGYRVVGLVVTPQS